MLEQNCTLHKYCIRPINDTSNSRVVQTALGIATSMMYNSATKIKHNETYFHVQEQTTVVVEAAVQLPT